MFVNNCGGGGYLPVPNGVHLWHPYILPGYSKRTSSTGVHISDILHLAAPSVNTKYNLNPDPFRSSGIQLLPAFASKYGDVDRKVSRKALIGPHEFLTGRADDKRVSLRHICKSGAADDKTVSGNRDNSSSKCLLSSALEPLQALCKSSYPSHGTERAQKSSNHSKTSPPPASSTKLKFGIHRILSEDFGKQTTDDGSSNDEADDLSTVQRSCVCSSAGCSAYQVTFPTHALTAVHALQPPQYPIPTGADTLPGPYSILNTEVNVGGHQKRKRSWSRAVFSNLQRKGLEKRFEVQKYVTKPDRRQLAAMLGLTDAQVKVWFQNRRMKWRHAQQQKQQDEAEVTENPNSPGSDIISDDQMEGVEETQGEPEETAQESETLETSATSTESADEKNVEKESEC